MSALFREKIRNQIEIFLELIQSVIRDSKIIDQIEALATVCLAF